MATKKFTDLPNAGALDGTEIFALVQSSVSKQEDLATIEVHILQEADIAVGILKTPPLAECGSASSNKN